MNIEEIMKPYFDKQEEFSKRSEAHQKAFENEQNELRNRYVEANSRYEEENKTYREQNQSYENEMTVVKFRLQRLRENKGQEIEEYVKNAISESSDFYAGYGAMIRKDLEQAYSNRERELENQIIELDNKINNNYLKIAENNKNIDKNNKEIKEVESKKYAGESKQFYKVDVRELIEIKEDLRKKLFPAKRNLEFEMKQAQINLDSVMLKLSMFKHTYDEYHNPTNGEEYRRLFEESNRLIEVKYNLEVQLKKLQEYLSMTELTEEEAKILLSGLNPVEQREYERRKVLNTVSDVVEEVHVDEIVEMPEGPEVVEVNFDEETTPVVEELPVDEAVETIEEPTYQTIVDEIEQKEQVNENVKDFLATVFDDIIDSARNLRTINLDGDILSAKNSDGDYEVINEIDNEEALLPNGDYISKKDIHKALDNYYKQNKGRTFKVNGIDKVFEVTRKTVRQIKKKLKESSVLNLVREKKLGIFDLRRVFGKEKADEYYEQAQVKETDIKMPSGDYINLEQFGQNLKYLFAEKSQKWTEKLALYFQPYNYDEEEYAEESEFEQLEEQKEKTR